MDAKELLEILLALPEAERETRLEAACDGDARLRREVTELLSYAGQSGDLLDSLGVFPPIADLPELPDEIGGYRILDRVGAGGSGVVYRARRGDAGGTVHALKVLRAGPASADGRRRFRNEGRALARLNWPGIPQFIESGVAEAGGSAVPFVVTQFIEGSSLRAWAAAARPGLDEVLEVVRRLAGILAYAHGRGVIHRDLKPENIVIDGAGNPWILDFGTARLIESEAAGQTVMTRVGQVVGTIPYMSPEQAGAGPIPVDCRTDLYSLGVIAYELLAGRLPVEVPGDSLHRAIVAILTTRPEPLGQLNPACRGNVEAIVTRMLEHNPADRYPCAEALVDDIARHRRGSRVRHRRKAPPRGELTRWIGAALGLVLVTAVGAWVLETRPIAGRPTPHQRAVISQVMADIGWAEDLIHQGPTTDEKLSQALRILRPAEEKLRMETGGLQMARLFGFLLWVRGEAQYMLGTRNSDAAMLAQADATWELAAKCRTDAARPCPLDQKLPLYRDIIDFDFTSVVGALTMLNADLADYETPLNYANRAVDHARNLPALSWEAYRTAPPGTDLAMARHQSYLMALNDLGGALLLRGSLTGSLADIDTAIVTCREAESGWRYPKILPPKGSMLNNLAKAWLARAGITGSKTDRDSARFEFSRALTFRPMSTNPLSHLGTRAAQARLALLDGAAAPAGERRTILESAFAALTLARRQVTRSADDPEDAQYRVLSAEILIEAAGSAADPALGRADSLIASAGRVLTEDRFPYQRAELLRVSALKYEFLWRAKRKQADREAALQLLTQARSLITPGQNPAFSRKLEQAIGRVRASS